jgi:hypothetical protein
MLKSMKVAIAAVLLAGPVVAQAAPPRGESGLARLPVKEVTVFKDGHAFILREGRARTGPDGNVTLDDLPTPIVGTFWAYASDPTAKLASVGSARRIVSVERTALNVPDLLRANVGRTVRLRDARTNQEYTATVLGFPERSSEEIARTSPPGTPPATTVQGDVVLLRLAEGVRAIPVGEISDVTFLGEGGPATAVSREEHRNLMTYRLDWGRRNPRAEAQVGMMYVERGIRWIPSYRVDIDGEGTARIKLQATLINELADLDGVKTHLVVGVPTFVFEDTPDPISLQEAVAQLSRHFRPDSQTAYAFSNAIMSQHAMPVRERSRSGGGRTIDLGPEVAGGAKNEDLYVFTLENVTLAKGARLVVPVAEFELAYRDVFVLDVPFSPPPEVRRRLNNEQQAKLARLFLAPKVVHTIRLANDSKAPITTAPALVLRDGRLVAQGMTTYTPVGASGDLELTTAVDIPVETVDLETGRTPNAAKWGGHSYDRIDLTGEIRLTNHRTDTIELEVRRSVLGNIDEATDGGKIEQLGWHEGGWFNADGAPFWWGWYSWPYWWYHFNSLGRVTWDLEIKPGESRKLEYTWHYFWRH